MEDDLFKFSSQDIEDLNDSFDRQLSKTGEGLQKTLNKARILCIRSRFDEALKIYEDLLEEDMECISGYIGILRVHSKDYTEYEGADIENDIRVITKIGCGAENDDKEYTEYIKARKEFLDKKNAPAPKTEKAAATPATQKAKTSSLPEGIYSKKTVYNWSFGKAFPSLLYHAEHDPDGKVTYLTGYCYYGGHGTKQDYEKAFYWYQKSAELGYADGQKNLGDCYYYGDGTKKDYEKAVYWYKKAAENGIGRAQYSLGRCYYYGQGVSKDEQKGIEWYKKAAKNGEILSKMKLDAFGIKY